MDAETVLKALEQPGGWKEVNRQIKALAEVRASLEKQVEETGVLLRQCAEQYVTAQAMLRRVKRDQEALLRGVRIHGNRKGRAV